MMQRIPKLSMKWRNSLLPFSERFYGLWRKKTECANTYNTEDEITEFWLAKMEVKITW